MKNAEEQCDVLITKQEVSQQQIDCVFTGPVVEEVLSSLPLPSKSFICSFMEELWDKSHSLITALIFLLFRPVVRDVPEPDLHRALSQTDESEE